MARQTVVKTTINPDERVLRIEVPGHDTLEVRVESLSPEVAAYAALHGLKQRIVDAAAISRDDLGRPASPADKWAAMEKLVAHYNSGAKEWGLRATGDGRTGGDGGLTLRAVAAVQGVEVRVMRARLDELAERRGTTVKALLAKLARQETVAAKMAELRGPAGPDGEDLLGELAGGAG